MLMLKAEQAAIKTKSSRVQLERLPAAFPKSPQEHVLTFCLLHLSHLFQAFCLPPHRLSLLRALLIGSCEYLFGLVIYPLTRRFFSHPVFSWKKKNLILLLCVGLAAFIHPPYVSLSPHSLSVPPAKLSIISLALWIGQVHIRLDLNKSENVRQRPHQHLQCSHSIYASLIIH